MPVELHERLSEFSYGYGVTREAEQSLRSVGMQAVPFLPSLLHEAQLGFDVAFDKPGAVLLMQFKLGQSMKKFVRTSSQQAPYLDRPFWRFRVDTSEVDGQFELMLKAEMDGAEAYYVAPRFSRWEQYLNAFNDEAVLERSLLIKPSEIRDGLIQSGQPDGKHRVVYDHYHVYVCSEPRRVQEVDSDDLAQKVRAKIEARHQTLAESLEEILAGFDNRQEIRREPLKQAVAVEFEGSSVLKSFEPDAQATRRPRITYERRARRPEDALVAQVGAEAWACGVQLIMATL
jgi:hypothetical protein